MRNSSTLYRSCGFALLEVLIAFVVLAFGLMGIASLLLLGHKANSSSYIKQQAIQSAYDIVDMARSNAAVAATGAYSVNDLTGVIPAMPAADCITVSCAPPALAAYDTGYWLSKDLGQLPDGRGSVTVAASGSGVLMTVVVQWNDTVAAKTLGANSAASAVSPSLSQFTVQTIL